jgi:hypothetical protein
MKSLDFIKLCRRSPTSYTASADHFIFAFVVPFVAAKGLKGIQSALLDSQTWTNPFRVPTHLANRA